MSVLRTEEFISFFIQHVFLEYLNCSFSLIRLSSVEMYEAKNTLKIMYDGYNYARGKRSFHKTRPGPSSLKLTVGLISLNN